MPINQESLNRRLYKVLHNRFDDTTALDSEGQKSPIEDEADVFRFTFTKDGEEYGQVYVTVDNSRTLKIYYDDDVSDSPSTPSPGAGYNDTWYGLLQFLKQWAMGNQLGWEPINKKHLQGDMARRNHMKKDQIQEGYYPMGKKASYSDAVPSVKMVIQHTREIQEGEQRYRNVARIFLENQLGERILAPTTKPGIARIYARHIAEGGLPHDDRWNHINGLCEEYSKMAGFVRATRGKQFNESAQGLIESGINHYNSLRESLSKMAGHRGYNMYFESWTPPLMEDDTDTTSITELFVQETMDPRIESVMPILSKLHKTVAEMREVGALAEWADSLLEGGDGGEASDEAEKGIEFGDEAEEAEEDLSEDESLTSNNPVGIPEGYDSEDNPVVSAIARRILLQRSDLLAKYGPVKVTQAIDDVADFVGDVDEIGSSDVSGWIKQVEQSLGGIDESALQAYLGDKKYGKDGMDALRKAGQEHASEKKMQNIRAKFSDKEKVDEVDMGQYDAVKSSPKGKDTSDWDKNFREKLRQYGDELEQRQKEKSEKVEEGEFAGDYATGEAGQWRNKGPKANKPATIGDLVGENFINTDAQAVVSEMDKSEDKKGPEGKAKPITPKKMADDAKKVLDKKKVKEGQEDLDAILRIIKK